MVLQVETPRIHYVMDGVTDTFSTGFTFEKQLELSVWAGPLPDVDCCATPTYDQLLAPDIDWVLLPGDYLTDGGEIQVLPHALPASGETLTLMRTTPPDQPENFGDEEEFDPAQHMATIDRITRMIQELYHNPFGVIVLGALAYEHRLYVPDAWTDQTPIDVHNYRRPVAYGPNLLGTGGSFETAPEAEKVCLLTDEDGTEIGTVTINPDDGVSFASTNPAGFAMNVDKQMKVVPPVGGLGACRGLAITFVGQVVPA